MSEKANAHFNEWGLTPHRVRERTVAAEVEAAESRNRLLELRQKTVQLLEAIDAGLDSSRYEQR